MWDKEGHHVYIKGFNTDRRYMIIAMYVANDKPSKNMKQKLTELKGETDSAIIIVGSFNIPLSIVVGKNN